MAQPPGFAGKGPLRLSGQFTGTMPIQEHQRFDVGALEAYLRNHGFSGPLAVRQFKGGQSNPTYLIDDAGKHYVLRAKPRSEEHTSELQSHSDLVCRLLLEKKKK